MTNAINRSLRGLCSDAVEFWNRFFFGEISLLPLGVYRFVLGLILFATYAIRQVDWSFFFTERGFVDAHGALEIIPEFYRPLISWFPVSDAMVLGVHSLFLISLLCLAFGLFGRWMAILALFLHLAFLQRNIAVRYGVDLVATFFLFGLAIADNSRCVSVDAWRRWRREERQAMHPVNAMLSTMGVRLIQLHLCIIYGYTGLEKMKGSSWWEGSAVWAMFGNQQLVIFDLGWMQKFPLLIAFMTHSTVLFEVYFPVLIWLSVTRKWVVAFGWLFHGMIALTAGLFFFSGVMMSTYLVFFNPEWLRVRLARFVPARFLGT